MKYIEEQILSPFTNIISKSPKQRFVDIVAFAYFAIDYKERKGLLLIYIQDVRHKKYKKVKSDTDNKEKKCKNRCYFEETKLTGLPEIIRRST